MIKQIKKILGCSMKVLYVHAGLPKNGSSALQVFFANHISELLNEGIDYFDLESLDDAKKGMITSGNGALLSRWFLNEKHEAYYPDGQAVYAKLINQIKESKAEAGLISSEFFANIPPPKLEQLKSDMEAIGVTVKFVFYARRQDQYLMSGYMQRVKRHGATDFPEDFVKKSFKNVHFLNYFDYAQSLENILGKGDVIPRIFESTKKNPKGLVGDFLQTILKHDCPTWVQVDPVVNTSPSALEIKFMLMANKFSPRMRFSDFVVEDSICAGRSEQYKTHAILKPEIIEEILSFFNAQNKNFEKEYGEGERFPDYVPGNYVDLEDFNFSGNEVMDIMSGFLVRFDRRLTRLEQKN